MSICESPNLQTVELVSQNRLVQIRSTESRRRAVRPRLEQDVDRRDEHHDGVVVGERARPVPAWLRVCASMYVLVRMRVSECGSAEEGYAAVKRSTSVIVVAPNGLRHRPGLLSVRCALCF